MDGTGHSLVDLAARNNAEWCDAFCRSHGIAGSFEAGRWSSAVRTPAHYPDVVTLRPDTTAAEALAGVDAGEGCSVKDSFAALDLSTAGFRPLFEAEWLVRSPPDVRLDAAQRWSIVTSAGELLEWEAAWGEAPGGPGCFRSGLLDDGDVCILAAHEGGRVAAGAVANRSDMVIGLSNVFAVTGDLESAWSGAAAAAAARWGHHPIVGYDSGEALAAAHEAGFESIGGLVVWLSTPPR